jgi:hypothetical protein
MRMIAKKPAERFSCMEELQKTLDRTLQRIVQVNADQRAAVQPAAARPSPSVGTSPLSATVAITSTPAQVAFLESDHVVRESDWEMLRRSGIQIQAQCTQPAEMGVPQDAASADLWVLSVTQDRREAACREWSQAGLSPRKTLLCIDAPLESPGLVGLADSTSNVLIGSHPVEPLALAMALRWMHWNSSEAVEPLVSHRAIQALQINSSSHRSYCAAMLMEDLHAQGIRAKAQQALQEVCEEMIMNVLFHAPLITDGKKQPKHMDRPATVGLPPGREAILRWVIGDRFIALSIRDSYGSLTPKDILAFATGPMAKPMRRQRGGAGLGLRMMSRAAQHLFFFISPGKSCDVMALVEREPLADSAPGHSLCVVQSSEAEERQIGDSLFLKRVADQEGICFHLRGSINETVDLGSIFLRSGTMRLDLSGVTSINSMGIGMWLDVSRKRSRGLHVIFERCSYAMVRQFNMLPDFVEADSVVSLLAPYFCPHCTEESMELVRVDEIREKGNMPPSRPCSKCGQELRFDEVPKEYFNFLGV